MKRIIYIIALFLAACSRNVTNKLLSEEKDYLSCTTIDSSFLHKLDSVTQFRIIDVDVEFSTIVYSRPDSLGNQYPISQTTGRILKKDSTSLSSVSSDQSATKSNNTISSASIRKESRTKETEVKPYVPPWLCVVSIMIVAFIASFIVVWIKKHGFY